jgi:hypothetical protein
MGIRRKVDIDLAIYYNSGHLILIEMQYDNINVFLIIVSGLRSVSDRLRSVLDPLAHCVP